MISILNRITSRARKLLILMIIIPVITAAVAAYMESKKPTTYTATSKVYVGNFNNNDLKPELSKLDENYLSTIPIKHIKKNSNGHFNVNDVKSRMVLTGEKNVLHLQYSGTNEKEVKDTLTDFTNGFLNYINAEYYHKKTLFDKLYNTTEQTKLNSSSQEVIHKQDTLFNMAQVIEGMKPARPLEINSPVAAYSNPLKRGIFGLILGLMLDIIIVVLPEFFREYR